MLALLRLFPLKVWAGLGVIVVALSLFAAYQYQKSRADRAEARVVDAVAVSNALETVATETPLIRQDQKEREHEVEQIPGADQRLPDGFGRDLQRVRDRPARDPR